MNHLLNVTLKILAGIIFAGMSAGCGMRHDSITIRTYIDGVDVIKISGATIWYEHESFNLPGVEGGLNEPTYVNGEIWLPKWNNLVSEPYEGISPAFKPVELADIQVSKITGRGDVSIVQMPTPENNQTISIKVDDGKESGADWYDILVSW